ncbi:MAG: hypothetical protein AAF501_12265 [Pseudomonadota bacterium]
MDIDLHVARKKLNPVIMVDRAWRFEFGHVVPYRHRKVMDCVVLAVAQEPGGALPPLKRLVPLVMEALDVRSQQTAEKYIDETRMSGLLTTRRSSTDRRVIHYVFAEGVLEKIMRVEDRVRVIHEVVGLQLANMDDPNAGYEKLPAGIYFNITSAQAE